MIVLYLTFLLNSLHHVTSYQYLPKDELPVYSYGGRNPLVKYQATLKEIPFHVLIVYSNLYCSGTIVKSKIVITAASCLLPDKIRRPIVKVGVDSVSGNGQIIPVIDIKIHEYYRYMTRLDNDIAMLMLKDHVFFGKTVKKALPVDPEVALRTGVTIEVSGWGSTNVAQTYVNQLIRTEMTVMDKEKCFEVYRHLSSPSNYCARYQPERRLSDNGGPAVYDKNLLVGLLSYGGISTEEPHVAIITNVSYFSRWISLNSRRFLEKYCVPNNDSSYFETGSDSDLSM